jgi:Family of unknown function (DUF5317)
MLAVLAAGIATVPLARGHLSRLLDLNFQHRWAIVAALAVQILIISIVPSGQPTLHQIAHLGSYALGAWFLIANRRVAFLWLVATGAAANLLAISANDGVMPARRGALAGAGLLPYGHQFANSGPLAHPRLLFLGDVFVVPRPFPLANVFSVGDIAIIVGAVLGVHALCGSRLTHRRHRSVSSPRLPEERFNARRAEPSEECSECPRPGESIASAAAPTKEIQDPPVNTHPSPTQMSNSPTSGLRL